MHIVLWSVYEQISRKNLDTFAFFLAGKTILDGEMCVMPSWWDAWSWGSPWRTDNEQRYPHPKWNRVPSFAGIPDLLEDVCYLPDINLSSAQESKQRRRRLRTVWIAQTQDNLMLYCVSKSGVWTSYLEPDQFSEGFSQSRGAYQPAFEGVRRGHL